MFTMDYTVVLELALYKQHVMYIQYYSCQGTKPGPEKEAIFFLSHLASLIRPGILAKHFIAKTYIGGTS